MTQHWNSSSPACALPGAAPVATTATASTPSPNASPDARFLWLDVEDEADLLDDYDVENFPTVLIQRRDTVLFFGTMLPHHDLLQRTVESFRSLSPDDSHRYANPTPSGAAGRPNATSPGPSPNGNQRPRVRSITITTTTETTPMDDCIFCRIVRGELPARRSTKTSTRCPS